MIRLGIDLGGTKIAAVALADDGAVLWQRRIPTPRNDYDATLAAIATLVDEGDRVAGGRPPVGLGMPGAISPATGLVKNANSTWLNGRALPRDLEQRLDRPIRLANDANCLAISEGADGAAAGARVVFAIILGTGVGGGLAVDGQVIRGANAIGGEWGHNPLPWPEPAEQPGPPCYCGKAGCVETWLSGPGLAADFRRRGGTDLPGEEVVALATEGDALASDVLDVWYQRLARALATIVNVVDPDVIIAGGGLSRISGIYDRVPALWTAWVFSDRVDTALRPARHGDASGVRGAARLWPVAPLTGPPA